jgi:Mg2+-importing ATPase
MHPPPKQRLDWPFFSDPLPAVLQRLDATPGGLTTALAAARLKKYGPNELRLHKKRALVLEFLSRLRNPLVLILLGASTISAFTGELTSCLLISAMVLMSILLDFVQEHRAGQAAQRLQQSVTVRATVLRDDKPQSLAMSQLVPGDVVQLAAGDLVPADGRVLQARDCFVNQSLLTGESYPVEKHAHELPAAAELQAADNAVFMGSSVISGAATVVICQTGAATAIGAVADELSTPAPPTAFELGTRRFGLLIMRLTLLLVLFVVLTSAVFHRPWLESFLFAVALAVGLTPELLPMIISVTLARGALRMAKKKVIVKHLPAMHNLGSMDVLCTDKTGTLTEAHIRLVRSLDPALRDSPRVLFLAYLNSAFETGLRSPLDEAILERPGVDLADWRKIDEVPFDFERRRVSVLVERAGERAGERLLVVKGAPEDILRLSTQYEGQGPGALQPVTSAERARLLASFADLGKEGFRVLAIAWRQVAADHPHAVVSDETELVFAGFVAFLDPPKPSAGQALHELSRSGVQIKILTGDNELVTQHVCAELGLPVAGLLLGPEVAALDDDSLFARAETTNLFCRVTPAQKNRILRALQARGHVVGFLGDGINDAPALHAADVGISVDSAVDVAKAAATMILLERDLAVLHEGILEGRATFGNVMKYIMMGTSSNFGNMFSMAAAALFLPFLPMLPMQILLNNLLYDISEIPIPMDRVDKEYLERPQRWDMRFVRNFMLTVGPVSSLFDILTFVILLKVLHAGEALFHTGWFVESIASQVLVIFLIRTRNSPLRSRPSPLLLLTSLAVVTVAVGLPFTPFARYLGFVPPPPLFFAILLAMVTGYLLMVEAVKQRFFRHLAGQRPQTGR